MKAKILQPGETMFYHIFLEKKNQPAIFIPIYDCIGTKVKKWKTHTFYFLFFMPGSQD